MDPGCCRLLTKQNDYFVVCSFILETLTFCLSVTTSTVVTFSLSVVGRCDFILTVVLSSGVYSIVRKQTCSSELWAVQRCVWCSFIVSVTVGASEWEWSKVRGSVWWTWRPLTPPCHQQWRSYWSWETRVWSLQKGILNVFSQSSSSFTSHRVVLFILRALSSGQCVLERSHIQLLPPVLAPEKVVCVGMNYRDHCLEQNASIPEEPIIFSKFPSAITGPYDDIILPPESQVRAREGWKKPEILRRFWVCQAWSSSPASLWL